jgi:hypothetical protein
MKRQAHRTVIQQPLRMGPTKAHSAPNPTGAKCTDQGAAAAAGTQLTNQGQTAGP